MAPRPEENHPQQPSSSSGTAASTAFTTMVDEEQQASEELSSTTGLEERLEVVELSDKETEPPNNHKRGGGWVPSLFGKNGSSTAGTVASPPNRSNSPTPPLSSSSASNNTANGHGNEKVNKEAPRGVLRRKKPKDPAAPVAIGAKSDSTQADILKQTMAGKKKPDKMNILKGGIFGAADWESDVNLAFKGYKTGSEVTDPDSGSRVSWGKVEERDSLASASNRESLGSAGSKSVSFAGSAEDDEEKRRSTSSADSKSNGSTASRRSTRISTMRKRDSRARSPRRSTYNHDEDHHHDGEVVDMELSRESWSHMRDSIMPDLDGMVGETENGRNQAKFLESAIKGKKKSLFGPISSIFGGNKSEEAMGDEDVNIKLRRATKSHSRSAAMSAAKARDEISQMDIYASMLQEDA